MLGSGGKEKWRPTEKPVKQKEGQGDLQELERISLYGPAL